MKFEIDKTSEVPVRQQIVRQVVFEIATGRLSGGTELPSVRELAGRHGIHPNTVSQAYQELVRLNWIKRHRGRKMVVRGADDPLIPHDKDIDDLINETVRASRNRGYSMQELRTRVQERLLEEPPDHVLVIERESGLLRLLATELTDELAGTGIPVDACLLDQLEANAGRAVSAQIVCLPGVVWHVAPLAGRHRAVFPLHLPDVDDLRRTVQQLENPSLIAFVSVSPYCLDIAEGLFAGVTGSRHTMERYCMAEGESRDLRAADLVFADSLSASQVKAGRLHTYRFVSPRVAGSIRSMLDGVRLVGQSTST